MLTALLICFCSFSQTIVTTPKGEKVKLNTDGTWEYVESNVEPSSGNNSKRDSLVGAKKCTLTKDEIDEFTGQRRRVVKSEVIGLSKVGDLTLYAVRIDEAFALYLSTTADLGCVSSNNASATIKFGDGSILKLSHGGKVDCGEDVTLVALVTDELEALRSKDVEKIRLNFTEYYDDYEISNELIFAQMLRCLST